jgi:hypothetical protein
MGRHVGRDSVRWRCAGRCAAGRLQGRRSDLRWIDGGTASKSLESGSARPHARELRAVRLEATARGGEDS